MICERCSGFSGFGPPVRGMYRFLEVFVASRCSKLHFLCRTPRLLCSPEPSNKKTLSIAPSHHLPFDHPPRFFSFARQFNIKDETIFSNLDGGATRAGRRSQKLLLFDLSTAQGQVRPAQSLLQLRQGGAAVQLYSPCAWKAEKNKSSQRGTPCQIETIRRAAEIIWCQD
jgi:hypothetical protein